jgi:diguanylate cyclase (GGDEF)-like protein/PAS domain S-box-containing protein
MGPVLFRLNAIRWRELLQLRRLPWLVLATGLLITAISTEQQRRYNQKEHIRIELHLAQGVVEGVRNRLHTDQAILDAVAGLFNASQQVTYAEFQAFIRSLELRPETLRGIQGVGFAAVVPNRRIEAFEAAAREDGQSDFRVRTTGSQELISSILFLQPHDWRNQRAIGFDMFSEATRRAAMREAAITGQSSLSGPVRLLQENSTRPQVGTLQYRAIYKKNTAPTSEASRLASLIGWAYSPLRMGDLIDSALSTVYNPEKVNYGVVIYDGNKKAKDKLLYDNQNLADSEELLHPTWKVVDVGGRNWLIGIQLDHTELSPDGWSGETLLGSLLGLSLSGFATLATRSLIANQIALRRALNRELAAAQERALAGTVFDTSPVAIVVTDSSGSILRVNPAFVQLSGYSAIEARGRKTNLLRSGLHDDRFYQELWEALIHKGHWNGEIWNRHRNGEIRRHEIWITGVLDANEQISSFVSVYRDVTEQHSIQEQIRHLATHDPLTGLPNRALLMDRLDQALALARRNRHKLGIIFIDLNGFKPINDEFGHLVGDQLLKQVAQRLKECVRKSDTLCRQGGDEFVLLAPEVANAAQLRKLAEKLNNSLNDPFTDLPTIVRISASFGAALWPEHGEDADGLLRAADGAMYRAKAQASGQVCMPADDEACAQPAISDRLQTEAPGNTV